VKHSLPPALDLEAFSEALESVVETRLSVSVLHALHAHYSELRRWSTTTSLIGPGTVEQTLERHYAESVRGLELVGPDPATLVDVGSGGGFPGFVLAALLAPATKAYLIDSKQRKVAFLQSAARCAGLDLVCVHGRVDESLPLGLPPRIDLLTLRAVRLSSAAWRALVDRLSEDGRVLCWTTRRALESPDLGGLPDLRSLDLTELERRQVEGSDGRAIVALGRSKSR